jgi:hypothetical protein
MKQLPLAIFGALVLADCAREAPVASHTVDEYRANPALRAQVFKKCSNDPGTLANTPDCINASEAERLESIGSLRRAPPIGLDQRPKRQP